MHISVSSLLQLERRQVTNTSCLLPKGILSSVDRNLTRHEYRKRLFIDAEFTRLRDALKVKQKELKKQGRGNKLNATTALPDEEIDTLLEKKSLGNKFSTIATEHCVAEKYHTIRSQRLHKRTKFAMGRWSDSRGKEYLVYTEKQTKSRQGDNPRNVRPVKPRMYENKKGSSQAQSSDCLYKLYRDKRRQSILQSDSSFYLTVNHFKSSVQGQHKDCAWFKA